MVQLACFFVRHFVGWEHNQVAIQLVSTDPGSEPHTTISDGVGEAFQRVCFFILWRLSPKKKERKEAFEDRSMLFFGHAMKMLAAVHPATSTSGTSSVPAAPSSAAIGLRVAHLNVLAHTYLDESEESFASRVELNTKHLLALDADVTVCVEVDKPECYATAFQSAGYCCTADRKNNEAGDYTCVFAKVGKVEVVQSETLRFHNGISSHFALLVWLRLRSIAPVDVLLVAWHSKAGRTNENEGRAVLPGKRSRR